MLHVFFLASWTDFYRYDPDLDILKYDPSHVENVKSPLRFYEG